jgi:hypothetical protein
MSTDKSGPLARASKGARKDRNKKESDADSDSEDSDPIKERLAKKQCKQVEKQRQQDELNKKQREFDELKRRVEERPPEQVFYVLIESYFTYFMNSSNLTSCPCFAAGWLCTLILLPRPTHSSS